MIGHKPFARGLSAGFMHELIRGRFTPLLRASLDRGLDLQIREKYINVYASGRSVLKLTETRMGYEADIHGKYLVDTPLPQARMVADEYHRFTADDAFVQAYLAGVETIISNAVPPKAETREATIEERIIRHSYVEDSPIVFIDRQIRAHGISKQLDLIGLSTSVEGETTALLVEIKQRLDNRIQKLMTQIGEYHAVFAPGGRLRQDVTSSYQTVVHQKKQLGVIPDNVTFPSQPPRVQCLLVLYAYDPKSRLLDRLRESARSSALRPKLVLIEEGCYGLPPSEEWEQL